MIERQFTIKLRLLPWLIIILITAGVATAWWNSPYLAKRALHEASAASGLILQDFSMQRPDSWTIRIDRVALASANIEMIFTDIEISPLSFNNVAVILDRISITDISGESSDSTPLDWQSLLEMIGGSVPLLPKIGFAQHIEFCMDECFSGELSWIRDSDEVAAKFNLPDEHLLGTLLLSPERSAISIIGHKSKHFLIEASAVNDNSEELSIAAIARLASADSRLHFESVAPVDFTADITAIEAKLEGSLPLDGIVSSASLQQQFAGRINLLAALNWQVNVSDTILSSQQPIAILAELENGVLHATLTSPVTIDVHNPLVEDVILIVADGSQCTVAETVTCSSPKLSYSGRLSSVFAAGATSSANFNLHEGQWKVAAHFDVTLDITEGANLDTTSDEHTAVATRSERITSGNNLLIAAMDLTASNELLMATTDSATILGMNAINLNISHSQLTDKGELTAQADRPAAELMGVATYLGMKDLSIESGEISFAANLGWDLRSNTSALAFNAEFSADNLNIEFNGFELHRGSVNSAVAGWPRIQSTKPVTMTWEEFDIGVPISSLQMSLNLDLLPDEGSYRVTGNSLKARLFGGTLDSHDFAYDLTNQNGHMMLELEKLDLQQVLALQQEEIESTGKISGSVPVHIEGGKLSVSQGTIAAIEPGGSIRYKPGQSVVGLVAGNEQLKVIVDTMSDFQYDSLDAALEYSTEGDLVARVSLKGSNPAFENGREIHLNLKLEENLADLLESLRLSDEVSTKIIRKAQDGVRR